MKGVGVALLALAVIGCGYTTRSFTYDGNAILISPVVNKIDITSETRKYSNYTTYPILLENRLTNEIVTQFNIDGGLKVVNDDPEALKLSCTITDYKKETMRYTESDDVKEQRLRLFVQVILVGKDAAELKNKNITGETSFFLTGPNQKSESAAQMDLIEDTARRIVEAVVEEW